MTAALRQNQVAAWCTKLRVGEISSGDNLYYFREPILPSQMLCISSKKLHVPGFNLCIPSPAAWSGHRAHLLCLALALFCQAHKGAQGHLAGKIVFQIPIMWLTFKYNQRSFFWNQLYQGTGRTLFRLMCSGYVCFIRMVAKLVSDKNIKCMPLILMLFKSITE